MLIPGIPEMELERLHYILGGGRYALALRHIPSGIFAEREFPPNVAVRQVQQELTVELEEKLRRAGLIASIQN